MAGPPGRQGEQGEYGPRGITGAFGWGYGTNTGPTGSIGFIQVVDTDAINGITLTPQNASTVFRMKTAAQPDSSYAALITLPGSAEIGQFWTFSNDLTVGASVNLSNNSSPFTFITTVPLYKSASLVYVGGDSTNIGNYILF